jgi:hypothetical protein
VRVWKSELLCVKKFFGYPDFEKKLQYSVLIFVEI